VAVLDVKGWTKAAGWLRAAGANIGAVRWSAFITCVLLGATPAWAAEWVRVETPNFIVYGEPGERRVREVADEFERFREALARVIENVSQGMPLWLNEGPQARAHRPGDSVTPCPSEPTASPVDS
jgi:hypothetical protein